LGRRFSTPFNRRTDCMGLCDLCGGSAPPWL